MVLDASVTPLIFHSCNGFPTHQELYPFSMISTYLGVRDESAVCA